MLTDAELITKVKSKNAIYQVTINAKRDEYPRQWLYVEADTKKDAIEFANEYAVRILGLKRAEYYVLAYKNM